LSQPERNCEYILGYRCRTRSISIAPALARNRSKPRVPPSTITPPSTLTQIIMSLRDSFSRLKKKLKHPVTGGKPKSDKTSAGTSNASAEEHKSHWKSTVSVSAKLLLRGVRDSADAFGPLKSVAGGLCFILENCEVSSLFLHTLSRRL